MAEHRFTEPTPIIDADTIRQALALRDRVRAAQRRGGRAGPDDEARELQRMLQEMYALVPALLPLLTRIDNLRRDVARLTAEAERQNRAPDTECRKKQRELSRLLPPSPGGRDALDRMYDEDD